MDQNKFTETVLPFKDRLYRLAKRILVSTDEAEDAVQEVLFKLWKGRGNLESYKNPEAFAMTMTKNYCLDRLKSKQASNLTLVHNNYKTKDSGLEAQVEAKDNAGMVFELIKKLPEQQRIILQLRDIEEYDYNEIAEVLDINETAIRVSLSRARKTIRKELLKMHNYGIAKN